MSNQPLIIGHRGSSAVAPENTIAAFSRAIRDGADGIEFDVRLARDQVPVIVHDATLARTAMINKAVSEFTSEELGQIDASAGFRRLNGKARLASEDDTVPTLAQVFQFFSGEAGLLYLEMKGEPVGGILATEVARLIRKHSFAERVVVESFDLSAIAHIKRVAPEIHTAALFERRVRQPLSVLFRRNIIERAESVKADEIALHHTLARDVLINQAKQSGLEVVVWTVEHQKWIARSQKLGIKALITNNPATMVRYRCQAAD